MGKNTSLAMEEEMITEKNIWGKLEFAISKKLNISERLIKTLINKNLEVLIIKTKPSIFDFFKKISIQLIKNRSLIVYSIKFLSDINAGIKVLGNIRLWHKPIFHIIVGENGISEQFKNLYKLHNDINELEKKIDCLILLYIDPIDDTLEFYSENSVKKILLEEFPEIEAEEAG